MKTAVKTAAAQTAQQPAPAPLQFTLSRVIDTNGSVVSKFVECKDTEARLEYFLGCEEDGTMFWWCAARYWKGTAEFCRQPLTEREAAALAGVNIFFLNYEDPVPNIQMGAEWSEADEEAYMVAKAEAEYRYYWVGTGF